MARTTIVMGVMLAAGASHAFAVVQRFQLDMSMLPSAQGWEYRSLGGVLEADAFSVAGGVLTQNTMGVGGVTTAYYQNTISLESLTGVTEIRIQARARVIEYENSSLFTYSPGIAFIGVADIAATPLYLNDNGVFTENSAANFTSVDTSVFHDYEIRVDTATRIYRIFVDGMQVLTGSAPKDINTYLQIGDVAQANALAEVTFARWTLIPAPSAVAAFGLFGVAALRRRR